MRETRSLHAMRRGWKPAQGSASSEALPQETGSNGCASSEGWHVQWETVPPGKKSDPVAWIAGRRETEFLKPIDKAIVRMVSESPGRNASEPIDGLETPSPGSRAPICWAKAAWIVAS